MLFKLVAAVFDRQECEARILLLYTMSHGLQQLFVSQAFLYPFLGRLYILAGDMKIAHDRLHICRVS